MLQSFQRAFRLILPVAALALMLTGCAPSSSLQAAGSPPTAVIKSTATPPSGGPVAEPDTSAASPRPAEPPQDTGTAEFCGQVRFYGVRGSGEKTTDFGGYGETIGTLRNQLYMKLPGIITMPIDYPAIPVNPAGFTYSADYVNSVEKGAAALKSQLDMFTFICPHSYFVLAGYSQGAEVVGVVYSRLSAEQRQHVASVTLFGDPRFNPDQWLVNQGDYSPNLSGIDVSVLGDRQVTVPTGWEGRVQSYCAKGDPICNYDIRDLPGCVWVYRSSTCVHSLYFEHGWIDKAATWIVSHLSHLPRLT